MICVYPSTEKLFENNGLKILHPLKATIRKEDNGDYYIDLKDVLENLDFYQEGMIIRAKTPWGNQGFRLTNPSIENNKIIAKGYHLYFDSKNYLIKDSYVVDKNCNGALDHLNNATDIKSPFTVLSDITKNNSYRCVRKTLEEAINDVIDRWGGHLYRDNFNIEIRDSIGKDRGVVIAYGKNIKKIKSSENWDNVITKILPVGKDGLLLPETYLEVSEKLYDIPYSKIVTFEQDDILEEDFTDENGELDTQRYENALIEDLRNKALAYLEENKLPKVNYSVDAYLKDVSDIGDTIYVKHPKCNINLTTNVIAIEYDCILERYTKIEFGNFKNNLKNLIKDVTASAVKKATDEAKNVSSETKALLEDELKRATAELWNTLGNSYVIYDGDKILIVDKLPKESAKNVIMINSGGIGFSSNGIDGTFNSAWQIDGTMNMEEIKVINFVADIIKGGTLKLGGEDNKNGIIEVYDPLGKLIFKIDNNGLIFDIEGNNVSVQSIISQVQAIDTTVSNNYQELTKKFDNYALNSNVVTLQENVTQLQTSTYSKTEVNSILEGTYTNENGEEIVTRVVKTTSGTFDENGMHYEKTGAETKSNINEKGFGIYNQNDNEILFAGYDDERKESVVRSDNFYVKKFLVLSEKSRFEDYKDGTGCFWIGGS